MIRLKSQNSSSSLNFVIKRNYTLVKQSQKVALMWTTKKVALM